MVFHNSYRPSIEVLLDGGEVGEKDRRLFVDVYKRQILKIVAIGAAGAGLVLIVNANRSQLAAAGPIRGLPWFVLEVLGLSLIHI